MVAVTVRPSGSSVVTRSGVEGLISSPCVATLKSLQALKGQKNPIVAVGWRMAGWFVGFLSI